jgi:hypothetical protein
MLTALRCNNSRREMPVECHKGRGRGLESRTLAKTGISATSSFGRVDLPRGTTKRLNSAKEGISERCHVQTPNLGSLFVILIYRHDL